MYRSSGQMYPIVEEYLQGKSSKKTVSKANSISTQVLTYWIKKYNSENKVEPQTRSFSALEIEVRDGNTSSILIELPNGTRIEIPMI